MTSAPTTTRLLSPLVAAIASLVCLQAACSFRSLDYLHNGRPQDGAVDGERKVDASTLDAADSRGVLSDVTPPDAAPPTSVVDALARIDGFLDARVPDGLGVGTYAEVGSNQGLDTSAPDTAGSSGGLPDVSPPDAALFPSVIDALPDTDSPVLNAVDSLVVGAGGDVGKDQGRDTFNVDAGSPDSARLDASRPADVIISPPAFDALADSPGLDSPIPDSQLPDVFLNLDSPTNLDSPGPDGPNPDSAIDSPNLDSANLDSPGVDSPAANLSALLVVGAASTLVAGDSAVQTRLVNSGYAVTIVHDSNLASITTVTATVVLISRSVSAATVGTKFRDVDRPVLVWEPILFDDMGFAEGTATTDGAATGNLGYTNQTPGFTTLDISPGAGELAAGLSGTVAVLNAADPEVNYAVTNAQALGVATLPGQPTKWSIFAYETGAQLYGDGGVARARRVGFFFSQAAPTNLTDNGWKLFDAAITWLTKSH
jgi:hypothetical protein